MRAAEGLSRSAFLRSASCNEILWWLQLYLGLATMAAGADANAGRVLAEAETALVAIAPDAVKPKNMAAKLKELSTIPRLRSFGSSAAASRETSATAASTTPNSR